MQQHLRRSAIRTAVRYAGAGLLLAGLLAWRGRPTAAGVSAVSSLALLVLAVVAPRTTAAAERALGRVAQGLGHALGTIAFAIIAVLVVIPSWGYHRLIRRSPLGHHRSAPPRWLEVQQVPALASISEARRLGSRASAVGSGAGPHRWVALGAVIVACAIVAFAVHVRSDDRGGPEQPSAHALPATGGRCGPRLGDLPEAKQLAGSPIDGYAHENEPWFPRFVAEAAALTSEWDPVLGSRPPNIDGRYLTVCDGRRSTYQPADPDLTVWYFGGSTMFGFGQRDEHTIPSEVARLAEADGISIRGVNFGIPAAVNWQETQLLAEALSMAKRPPDLVVFYDGVNEFALGYERMQRGDIDPDRTSRQLLTDTERELWASTHPHAEPVTEPGLRLQVELASTQYARGVDVGRHLAKAYGFPVLHVWQPSLLSKRLTPTDRPVLDRTGFDEQSPERAAYLATMEESGADPVDLTTALDGAEAPVYLDSGHTNELGATLVARALYESMRPILSVTPGP